MYFISLKLYGYKKCTMLISFNDHQERELRHHILDCCFINFLCIPKSNWNNLIFCTCSVCNIKYIQPIIFIIYKFKNDYLYYNFIDTHTSFT